MNTLVLLVLAVVSGCCVLAAPNPIAPAPGSTDEHPNHNGRELAIKKQGSDKHDTPVAATTHVMHHGSVGNAGAAVQPHSATGGAEPFHGNAPAGTTSHTGTGTTSQSDHTVSNSDQSSGDNSGKGSGKSKEKKDKDKKKEERKEKKKQEKKQKKEERKQKKKQKKEERKRKNKEERKQKKKSESQE